jgi:hypothetical protein
VRSSMAIDVAMTPWSLGTADLPGTVGPVESVESVLR